jgi:nicotinate-nucleotide adenylyltransferase
MPLPPHAGLRVGLFGGSFNPPHEGHRRVAETALKRLRLDAVWWLVARRNPLKDPAEVASLSARLAATRALAAHPRFHVLPLEAWTNTLYTVDLLTALAPVLARGHFVWIMGTDTFAGLHRWKEWQVFMSQIPLAVLARPGSVLAALNGRAARTFRNRRLPARLAPLLPFCAPPAWCFLDMPRSPLSSTCLRHPRSCRRS